MLDCSFRFLDSWRLFQPLNLRILRGNHPFVIRLGFAECVTQLGDDRLGFVDGSVEGVEDA